MPACGNLKFGDSLFCIIPPPKKRTTNPPDPDPPRPTIRSSPQFVTCEWFRTLYEVLHEEQTITIWFYDCNGKIISVSDELP